jgi:succinate dehydrogenase flavin-adding protein (antitoxin of CptAB toxin-antitoxin module)
MTQPFLLEQAKQGDPQAIAALMNNALQPKGMTAYVERQGEHLEVVLQADRIPNRQSLTDFVERGIETLNISSIKTVRVTGQQIGALSPAWEQHLAFDSLLPSFVPDADLSSDLSADLSTAMADVSGDRSNYIEHDREIEPEVNQAGGFQESIHDLSQLQEELTDPAVQPPFDPQRQELESRLESLWAEQSDEAARDFLAELMTEEPQDSAQQFESFLIEQSDDRFQSREQEGLWVEPAEDPDLLAELELDDARTALSEQIEAALQQPDVASDSSWFNAAQTSEDTDDEPDEVLFTFLEDSPPMVTDTGLDEFGEPIDEPDEVLFNFLGNEPTEPALSQTMPLAELAQPSEGADHSETPYLSTDDDLLFDAPDLQDPDLLLALTGDDRRPADSESLNWVRNDESTADEFTPNEFANPTNELSLGVDNEPNASQIDGSADQFSATANDTTASWDSPAIEFLQPEPEPLLSDIPTDQYTDQYHEPLVDPGVEPDISSDRDALAEFPPDFLQEFQETPIDQSEDLYVVPQSNPFIEQMQGQDNNQQPPRSDADPNAEFDRFDQTDWILDESDLDSSEPSPGLDESFQFTDFSDASAADPLTADDPLSDEALIDFFAEEPIDETATDGSTPPYRWSESIDNPDAPLSEPGTTETASFNQEFPGSALMGDDSQFAPYDEFSADAELAGTMPDTEIPEPAYPDTEIPEPAYPDTEIPEPAYSSSYPDTEIPEPSPISAYEEPSQEALEQQLAEFDLENSSAPPPTDELVAVEGEVPAENRGTPWLFPLILLGISGWIVGLISFAFLWSRLSSPTSVPETSAADPAAPGAVASPNAAPTTCPPTTTASTSDPIALSSLQFQPASNNPQQVNLIGCVTNRTSQPIDLVSIGYQAGTGSNSDVGGLNLPNSVVQPGQTVPFTSKFTLPSEVTDVSINTVYWQPAGQTTSQEAATSVNLNR